MQGIVRTPSETYGGVQLVFFEEKATHPSLFPFGKTETQRRLTKRLSAVPFEKVHMSSPQKHPIHYEAKTLTTIYVGHFHFLPNLCRGTSWTWVLPNIWTQLHFAQRPQENSFITNTCYLQITVALATWIMMISGWLLICALSLCPNHIKASHVFREIGNQKRARSVKATSM